MNNLDGSEFTLVGPTNEVSWVWNLLVQMIMPIGVRANIHLGGRPSFARMDSVGGGG